MAVFRYTIEPNWTAQSHSGEIEIDDAELEGLDSAERDKLVQECLAEAVNNDCPWGWEEVNDEED